MDSPDKLTIDTPEQTVLEYPIAGLGSRSLALLADTAIQIIIGFFIFIAAILLAAGVSLFGTLGEQWIIAIIIFLIFLLKSGYFALFEIFWNGQTPGKRHARIRVIKEDGRPIGVYEAVVRNVVRIVDELPGIYGVGLVCVFLNKKGKRLGDHLAGTVVVHEKTLEGVRPFTGTKIDESLPPIDVSVVTLDEIHLIEAFLNRRDSLTPDIRTSMSAQICIRLASKMNVTIYGWPRTERFLEAVMESCRQSGRFRN